MSADVAARLRMLAQDHHDGRLDLAAYRALRAPLLDSLVLNTAIVASAMEITQPRATRPVGEDATTRPGKPHMPGSAGHSPGAAPPSPSVASSNPWLGAPTDRESGAAEAPKRPPTGLIAVGVAIIAVGAVAFWMWRTPSQADRSSPTMPVGAADHVHDLVAPFVERSDWSDGRLTSLNASLLELGGVRIAAVAREAWFQRFVDELRRRLKEQQALAPTPLTVDNSPLAALAVTVGIDLNSPDAAIHIEALPPARPPEETAGSAERSGKSGVMHHAKGGPTGEGSTPAHSDVFVPHSSSSGTNSGTDAAAGDQAASSTAAGQSPSVIASTAASPNAKPGAMMASLQNGAPHGTTASAVPTSAGENACRVELIGSRRPVCHDVLPSGSDAPLMALVPAGAFEMGSTVTAEEQPVHHVTIREPFAISVYEVSQGEFRQFCEQTHRACTSQPWTGDDYPVVNVSWDDAHAYADWLTSVTHQRYSLPTEAQWEYAARAGQTGLFPGGDALSPTDAHYSMVARETSAARRIEKFKANAFRLVHVVGNVREWVEDGWAPNFAGAPADGSAMKAAPMRVARGGSYTDGAARLRLSMREGLPAGTRDTTTGFRIVRELP